MASAFLKNLYKQNRHTFRERRLCRGNATYERLMAEAKVEYDQLIAQGKLPKGKMSKAERARRRAAGETLEKGSRFFKSMRVNDKVRNKL